MAQVSYGTITIIDTTDIDHIESFYLAYSSNTGVTTSTAGWTTNIQQAQLSDTNPYLWTYEKYWGTGNVLRQTSDPRVIGTYSIDGRGVVSDVKYYGIAAASEGVKWDDRGIDGPVEPSDPEDEGKHNLLHGWNTTPEVMTPLYPYLWCYEVITYTTGESERIEPYVIGVLGRDGQTGPQGPQGEPGTPGDPGIPGTPGASVISSIPLYYLKTQGDTDEAPSISTSDIIYEEDISDQWTTIIPSYSMGGLYYTCLQSILSDSSNPIFSDVVPDYSLTDSKLKILALEAKTHHIVQNSNGLAIASGIDGITFNAGQENTYGYNSIAAPGYIALRYNDKNLMQLNSNGMTLYSSLIRNEQNQLVQGPKALEVNSNGLQLYNPATGSSAVNLTREGLSLYNNSNLGLQLTDTGLKLYDPTSNQMAAQLAGGNLTFYTYDSSSDILKQIASYGSDISIGDTESYHIKIKTNSENGEVGFYYRDNEVAYINTEQLYIKRSVVLNEMLVGEKTINEGTDEEETINLWAWRHDPTDDSIYLKWLGESLSI